MSLPILNTPGRRWKFKRNLALYAAWKFGFSHRALSEVFDLPRSRIAEVILEAIEIERIWKTGRDGDDPIGKIVSRLLLKSRRKSGLHKD